MEALLSRRESMLLDNVIPVIPVDYKEHVPEKPFCWDATCPDKEDQDAIDVVAQWITDGLMTLDEASDFVRGRGV